MAKLAKFLQGVAGAGGGAGLNVEEVFSTYLYEGNGSTQTITNGIDLDGEGGLVWVKDRSGQDHYIFDTERGVGKKLASNNSDAEFSYPTGLSAFNSDGFSLGGGYGTTGNTLPFASWTFRKAPKFFDVVTYTGNGTSGRTVSHNLGSVPGCIIVKRTDTTGSWRSYHTSLGATKYIDINSTSAAGTSNTSWADTEPTSTEITLGSSVNVNASGGTYVAYLFAHNDGDGEFGPDGDADIIKCGSYTGGTAPISVDLGFEPQWILIKGAVGSTQNWVLFDTMRGIATGGADEFLSPNSSSAETTFSTDYIDVTANGFEIKQSGNAFVSQNSATYIYIAIRRGPMAVPTDATNVFDVQTAGNLSGLYSTSTGFTPDTAFYRDRDSNQNNIIQARLTETQLITNSTTSEFTSYNSHLAGNQDGIRFDTTQNYGSSIIYQWKRAPNYFDVVAYTGDNSSSHAINHNLNAVPEMMWVKGRDIAKDWNVYHSGLGTSGGTQGYLSLNKTDIPAYSAERFAAAPTDTQFTVGNNSRINSLGSLYIAYLFASLDGVSKVGSYTGNGSSNGDSQNIDCGFSSGARFVLIKRTDISASWIVFDSARGIIAGDDPILVLSATNAEFTTTDEIDPYSSGFAVTIDLSGFATNVSGASYIFYAIA